MWRRSDVHPDRCEGRGTWTRRWTHCSQSQGRVLYSTTWDGDHEDKSGICCRHKALWHCFEAAPCGQASEGTHKHCYMRRRKKEDQMKSTMARSDVSEDASDGWHKQEFGERRPDTS